MTESPPMMPRAASMRAKETAANPVSRLVASDPMPIAKTMTDRTMEAWTMVSPSR